MWFFSTFETGLFLLMYFWNVSFLTWWHFDIDGLLTWRISRTVMVFWYTSKYQRTCLILRFLKMRALKPAIATLSLLRSVLEKFNDTKGLHRSPQGQAHKNWKSVSFLEERWVRKDGKNFFFLNDWIAVYRTLYVFLCEV